MSFRFEIYLLYIHMLIDSCDVFDLCCVRLQDGICDRAFSPRADVMCGMNCKASLCAKMCDTLDQGFQAHNQSNPSPRGRESNMYVCVL